jgi:hypothetical protein
MVVGPAAFIDFEGRSAPGNVGDVALDETWKLELPARDLGAL